MAEKESGFDKKFIEEKGEHMEGGMLGNLAHYLSYGKKMTDKFVDSFLTREGESVEDAKARMTVEQKAREEKDATEREERKQKQATAVKANR